MKKNYNFILFAFLTAFSCGTDDALSPADIDTNPDAVTIQQNTQIEIFVLSNDSNVPTSGQLTISNPTNGEAIINDNSTPDNPSDDTVIYTAKPNKIGLDNFQYTICNSSGVCKTETVSVSISSSSNVLFNLENLPYQTLSEYQLFEGDLKDLEPSFGVIPYTLNSTLFTDYSKKKRFIWLPNNATATYINDNTALDFPVGTILVKNFYYDNVLPLNETRLLETRLMIRKNEGWVFANYVWNNEQTEATFNLDGSFVDIEWQDNDEVKSLQYRIPAGAECHTCHKIMEVPQPIGPKPRNLNLVFNYSNGAINQLDRLIEIGYLANSLPATVNKLPDYNDTNEPLDLRVRAYLDINCAHCHSEETHCDYRPMRFGFEDTQDFTNIGVCVDPDTDLGFGLGHIVEPGDPRNSVLHYRISSTEPSDRMPLLGRTTVHYEGVELIESWINSLNNNCN